MKIHIILSAKNNMRGKSEIILRTNKNIRGKVLTMRAGTKIYIDPAFFSEKEGVDISRKRLVNPDVRQWHVEAKHNLNRLLAAVDEAGVMSAPDEFSTEWLRDVVDRFWHPERYGSGEDGKKSFFELVDEYLKKKQFPPQHERQVLVLLRAIYRYEGFVRATDKVRKNFTFNAHLIDRSIIEEFMDYLRNEKRLSEEYPQVFKDLFAGYPDSIRSHIRSIGLRGENSVVALTKMLKALFNWLLETGRTKNHPFDGVKIGAERYGTPYYISIEERNKIAKQPMPTKRLETLRDVFVFHCFVGCRVSDLIKLTEDNIYNGMLVYTPHKTKDDGVQSRQARVPLHAKAVALIDKYRGVDERGRLFPFPTPKEYNVAIKLIFVLSGITRKVMVRNAKTGEDELRAINEIASSHIARRTFIGNAYRQVADPNIIGKMSGHAEGSMAFARYRNIEDDTLRNVIDKLG